MNKKAFTIIELIVVIAIIGILVLLATPKFIGYTEEIHRANILNDTKVMENKIEEYLIRNDDKLPSNFKEVDTSVLEEAKVQNKLYNLKGLVPSDNVLSETFKEVAEDFIKTRLEGSFYVSQDTGKVYYIDIKSGKTETPNLGGDETNKNIEDELKDLENKVIDIGDNLSDGELSAIEDEVSDIQNKIDKLAPSEEKNKAQEDLDEIKNKLDELKIKRMLKELAENIANIDENPKKEIIDSLENKASNIQKEIDKLAEGSSKNNFKIELNNLKDELKRIKPVIEVSELPLGSVIYDPNWEWEFVKWNNTPTGGYYTYKNEPVKWVITAKNHQGYPSNSITVLSYDFIGYQMFDNSTDREGGSNGSPHWGNSGTTNATFGIRKWLNGSSYMGNDNNNYDTTFYDSFSKNFKENILTTTLPNLAYGGENYTTEDKVFIPSQTEVGFKNTDSYFIGSVWQYYKNSKINDAGYFYTRSIHIKNPILRQIAGNEVYYGNNYVPNKEGGIRPALNLKSDALVISDGQGKYKIVY